MSTNKRPSAAEALGDIFPPSTPPTQAQSSQADAESAIKKYGKPATYRLPEDLIKQLKAIAKRERVGISDLATFALKNFVERYEADEIALPKTEDVSYKLNL